MTTHTTAIRRPYPYPVISLPPPNDCEQIEHGSSSRPPAAVRARQAQLSDGPMKRRQT
ncbi:unnamed protein product [Urochloa humidicola]